MIVPTYWAESRRRHRERGRQITVRRFGWSDLSAEDAQAVADRRAEDALDRLRAGETLPRRERKRPYHGAEGVPIREQIVHRDGESIVTRNAYGARCLNTPDVLFADVDFDLAPPRAAWWLVPLLGLAGGVTLSLAAGTVRAGVLPALGIALVVALLLGPLHRAGRRLLGGDERLARRRVDRFIVAHPEWHLRLYRTPAGLRLLAMHGRFDPRDPAVAQFFEAVRADPQYVRMCRHQRCFRARLGPKPWRVGLKDRLRPRPGVWPVPVERLREREVWLARYEAAARGYAACRYLGSVGRQDAVDPQAEAVRRLHDDECGALQPLPLA